MTLAQICLQLRSLLKARTWADAAGVTLGAGEKVFGENVIVSAGSETSQILSSMNTPCCVIVPGPSQRDSEAGEDPRLRTATVRVKVIQSVMGDAYGEALMVGANIANEGGSSGHGLLEVEEQVEYAVGDLSQTNGCWIYVLGSSQPIPVQYEGQGSVAYMDVDFDVKVTTSRYYPSCPVLTATGGSGQVALTWSLAPDRYDRYRVVLRRASGATAPTSISSGAGVTIGAEAVTVTDTSLSAGDYSYALFQTYDDRSATPDSDDHVSESITQTSVTVSS